MSSITARKKSQHGAHLEQEDSVSDSDVDITGCTDSSMECEEAGERKTFIKAKKMIKRLASDDDEEEANRPFRQRKNKKKRQAMRKTEHSTDVSEVKSKVRKVNVHRLQKELKLSSGINAHEMIIVHKSQTADSGADPADMTRKVSVVPKEKSSVTAPCIKSTYGSQKSPPRVTRDEKSDKHSTIRQILNLSQKEVGGNPTEAHDSAPKAVASKMRFSSLKDLDANVANVTIEGKPPNQTVKIFVLPKKLTLRHRPTNNVNGTLYMNLMKVI